MLGLIAAVLIICWLLGLFAFHGIHRFIPRTAGCRHHPPDYAFRVREKGQRIRRGDYIHTRDEVLCVRCRNISSPSPWNVTIPTCLPEVPAQAA
jgi:hypothetical protein